MPTIPTKEAVPVEKITQRIKATIAQFALTDELENIIPSADVIPSAKTPVRMTEPMLGFLLRNGFFLEQYTVKQAARGKGRRAPDIAVETREAGWLHVELKATKKDFQNYSQSDIQADVLFWLDIRPMLGVEERSIRVYELQAPEQYFDVPSEGSYPKISLSKFREQTGTALEQHKVNLEATGLLSSTFSLSDIANQLADRLANGGDV